MRSLVDTLRKLFGNESLDYILEMGSLFTNQLDKLALIGKLAFDIYSENEFDADKIELLTTTGKIRSAVNSILGHGYEIRSVAHDNEFYEVHLAKKSKEKSQVVVYAFSYLPNVIKDAKISTIKNNEAAYNISLASPEDTLLVGLMHNDAYPTLMDRIDRKKLNEKCDKLPEELGEVKNKCSNYIEIFPFS